MIDRVLAVRVGSPFIDHYNTFKASVNARKESELLRTLFQLGLITATYLQSKDRFIFNHYKLKQRLEGLLPEEKAELLEMLKQELAV